MADIKVLWLMSIGVGIVPDMSEVCRGIGQSESIEICLGKSCRTGTRLRRLVRRAEALL